MFHAKCKIYILSRVRIKERGLQIEAQNLWKGFTAFVVLGSVRLSAYIGMHRLVANIFDADDACFDGRNVSPTMSHSIQTVYSRLSTYKKNSVCAPLPNVNLITSSLRASVKHLEEREYILKVNMEHFMSSCT